MTPCYLHPPHSPDGNHNAGSRAQNASLGNEPVLSKNTRRAPTIKQEDEDHPGKLLHDRHVLKHDTRRIAANDDRKPAPVIKTEPPHQDDAPRLPKNSKRRASMHPGSDPVPKRAKKQDPPVDCSNDILRLECDAAKEDVSPSVATLRQESEAMSAAHEAALKQKDKELGRVGGQMPNNRGQFGRCEGNY
jgi:hypothetical protein